MVNPEAPKNNDQEDVQTTEQQDYSRQLKEALDSAGIVAAENPPEEPKTEQSIPEEKAPEQQETAVPQPEESKPEEKIPERDVVASKEEPPLPAETQQESPEQKNPVAPAEEPRLSKEDREKMKINADVSALERMAKDHADWLKSQGEQKNSSAEVQPAPVMEAEKATPEIKETSKIAEPENEDLVVARELTKERAFEVLSKLDIVNESPEKLGLYFKALTGKNLEQEADAAAEKILKSSNMETVHGQISPGYRKEAINRELEQTQRDQQSFAVSGCWERLSAKDQAKFKSQNSGEFKNFLKEKAERLGLREDEFLALSNARIAPEKCEKRNWFTSILYGRFKITDTGYHYPQNVSKKEFYKAVANIQNELFEQMRDRADRAVGARIVENERRFQIVRRACAESLIGKAMASYTTETLQNKLAASEQARKEAQDALAVAQEETKNENKPRGSRLRRTMRSGRVVGARNTKPADGAIVRRERATLNGESAKAPRKVVAKRVRR